MKTTFLVVVMILYVVWSQLTIHQYKQQIENERQRAFNIADLLEIWKEIIASHDIRFDVDFFKTTEETYTLKRWTAMKMRTGTNCM